MLLTRTLSAVVLAPPVLLAIWFGGWWFAALVVLAAGLMGWEWARLCDGGRLSLAGLLVIATLLALTAAYIFGATLVALAALAAGAVLTAVAAVATRRGAAAWYGPGTLYVGIACLSFLWLRGLPVEEGRNVVCWLLVLVWATDIGAYFAGRGIGGPKLAPRISPNKTWAGLVGGAIAAAAVSAAAAGPLGRDALALGFVGLVLAVVAQGGDLLESWCKRRFRVKDSSHIIPGHGGILDRVDGLLAVLPVAFLYFWVMREAV